MENSNSIYGSIIPEISNQPSSQMLCSAVPLYGSQALQRKDSAISVNIIGLVGLQGFFFNYYDYFFNDNNSQVYSLLLSMASFLLL